MPELIKELNSSVACVWLCAQSTSGFQGLMGVIFTEVISAVLNATDGYAPVFLIGGAASFISKHPFHLITRESVPISPLIA